MIAYERRASAVLFNLLRSHEQPGPFLLPANVCPIVPMIFLKAGRPFEFIDISMDTFCIDHDAVVERWLAPKSLPAGVVYVRTYGAVFDATTVFRKIKAISPGALIVDDRCLCVPDFSGELAPYADVALYSTGYAKHVDIGVGGYGVLREGVPYGRAGASFLLTDLENLERQYKESVRNRSVFVYSDSSWLDTASPQTSWEAYKEEVARGVVASDLIKQASNAIYASRLPPEIQLPPVFQSWRFNIQVGNKNAVLEEIERAGLFASGHYASLAGVFGPGRAVVAETLHRHVINLFNDRYFDLVRTERLSELLASVVRLKPGPLFQ